MSTIEYRPAPRRRFPRPVTDTVTIDPPAEQESSTRTANIIQKALMIGFPLLMIAIMGIMFTSGMFSGGGGRQMMMMVMMPLMVVGMVAGQVAQMFGSGAPEMEVARRDNVLSLGENRKKAHAIGNTQHYTATLNFPHPNAMPQLITQGHDTFWSIRPQVDEVAGAGSSMVTNPYMHARIGTGMVPLDPPIQTKTETLKLQQLYEPVTLYNNTMFLAVQNVVPNCPVGYDLSGPAYGMRGNTAGRMALARTMILSLAYAHSPNNLSIGVITSDAAEWDWIKWLPHTLNIFEPPTEVGYRTLAWDSMQSASADLANYRRAAVERGSRLLILVDLPDVDVAIPKDSYRLFGQENIVEQGTLEDRDTPPVGVNDITFLVVRAGSDIRLTAWNNRILVEDDDTISVFERKRGALLDPGVTAEVAEHVARVMSPYRPPNFGYLDTASGESVEQITDTSAPTILEAIGATDLERFDVRALWRSTDPEKSFRTPIGFRVDATRNQPTGDLAHLDILQHVSGGTGPHGLFVGGTGSGKSFLLKAIILMMCARFSPRRLVIIGADFKGGATFAELERLPHFIANITNLDNAADMVDRTRAVLDGEALRRQELFRNAGVEDIYDYREKQKTHPELPDVPDLLFVADEFREFIMKNRSYQSMFASLGAIGRSLGIHLLLTSQFIDQMMLGDAMEHFTYGIALKVGQASYSQAVINKPDAAHLPPNKVALMMYHDLQDQHIVRFQGFNHALPYVPPTEHDDEIVAVSDGEDRAAFAAAGVTSFSLAEFAKGTVADSSETIDAESPAAPVVDPVERVDEKGRDQFTALIDTIVERGSDYTDVYQMWPTPLSVPMTLTDVEDWTPPENYPDAETAGPVIRIGDVDVPHRHTRVPMNVDFSRSGSNLAIFGDPASGKSMTVKTMVASSALRYSGNYVSWMLYDHTITGLSPVSEWHNVAAHGTRSDKESWLRMYGEVTRLLQVREAAFAKFRPRSLREYIEHRAEWGVQGDNYGHVMLVIDGFDDFFDEKRADDINFADDFRAFLTNCSQFGIHVIATVRGTSSSAGRVIDAAFQLRIYHAMADAISITGTSREMREMLKMVPSSEPGRVVDGSQRDARNQVSWLHGRVMLPLPRSIEPDPTRSVGGIDVYLTTSGFPDEIVALGEQLRAKAPQAAIAPKVQTVGNDIPFSRVWEMYAGFNFRALEVKDRPLPLAVDCSTAELVALDPSTGRRHMIVTGDPGVGVTSALRAHMLAVTGAMTPQEARIIVLDSGGGLYRDARALAESGYMKMSSYAPSREAMEPVLTNLANLARNRKPKEGDFEALEGRKYFSGPEVFVYVDGAHRLMAQGYGGGGDGSLESVIAELTSGHDLGIRFIVGIGATQFQTATMGSGKFLPPLINDLSASVALMSGGVRGPVIDQVRFERLVPGRAKMYDKISGRATLVQFGHAEAPPA